MIEVNKIELYCTLLKKNKKKKQNKKKEKTRQ
jgi:hypothetical protein